MAGLLANNYSQRNPPALGDALSGLLGNWGGNIEQGLLTSFPFLAENDPYKIGQSLLREGVGLGTIAGVNAKTLNPKTLELAEQMRDSGASRDDIWKSTGEQFGQPSWFDNGQFMWEIDDSGAKYLTPAEVLEESKRLENKLVSNKDVIKTNADSLKIQGDIWEKDLKKTLTGLRRENKDIRGLLDDYEGVTRVADGTGSAYWSTPLKTVFQHKELEAAYPGIFDYRANYFKPSQYQDYRGFHLPNTKEMGLRDDLGEDMTSVGLHEVNHAIQTDQGFPRGNNPDQVVQSRVNYIDDVFGANEDSLQKWRELSKTHKEMEAYAGIDNILDFMDIKQPRHLFNTQQYHEYSHYLRLELGPPPKRGPERLKWAQDAGQLIAHEEIGKAKGHQWWTFYEEDGFKSKLAEYSKDRKSLKNKKRRLDRRLSNLRSDTEQVRLLKNERGRLAEDPNSSLLRHFTPEERYQMYLREHGEAMSRAVQHRMGMSLDERINKPIWKSLDVPESEIFRQYPESVAKQGLL